LAQLAAGDFTIESRGCLVAGTERAELTERFGFNDVVLARLGRTGALSVDLTVNDLQYGYYKCDAVVVSTPSGSTAYNYAAGGPVLSPSAAATVITPVAPMAGISRAVVLGADDHVKLTVAEDSAPVAVDVDGTAAGELKSGDVLTAALRVDAAEVVRFSAGVHASRSRVKLSLLDLPLRRDQLLELIPESLRQGVARASLEDPRA
jgi:NAD+ kinase